MRGYGSVKLGKCYFRPYCINCVIGLVAYELVLPECAQIHPVFHVSKLNPFHGTSTTELLTLDSSVTRTLVELRPSRILDHRILHIGKGDIHQFLVKWEGLPSLKVTWEDVTSFRKSYPNSNLEDKVVNVGEGNNTTRSSTIEGHGVNTPIETSEVVNHVGSSNSYRPKIPRPKCTRKVPNHLNDFIYDLLKVAITLFMHMISLL
ncbi:hypothetical protein HKD37_07G019540 [Glycine soja]